MILHPLQFIFLIVSLRTWERRKQALQYGMPFSEETVTENILLDIMSFNYKNIVIIPFNKSEEGKIGADWEWCICAPHRSEYLTMLVQAKVLDNRQREYSHLFRFIGNSGVRQIDKFLKKSHERKSIPIYSFYNHIKDTGRIPHNCCLFNNHEIWGCSMALAELVKAKNTKKFDDIAKFSNPWVCMLCPHLCTNSDNPSAPSLIYNRLSEERKKIRKIKKLDHHFYYDGYFPEKGPHKEPPSYFYKAMELPYIEDYQKREKIIENLAKKYPDLDGILIYRQDEERG